MENLCYSNQIKLLDMNWIINSLIIALEIIVIDKLLIYIRKNNQLLLCIKESIKNLHLDCEDIQIK